MQDSTERDEAGGRRRNLTYVCAATATAVGLTALATAGLAGTAGATDRAESAPEYVTANGVITKTIVVDLPAGAVASATPGTGTATAPKFPQMRLALSYQRQGKLLTLKIALEGYVYEPVDAKGKAITFATPAQTDIGLGEDLAWGDGSTANTPAGTNKCGDPKKAQKVHQIQDSYTLTKRYAKNGKYDITYAFKACGLTGGKISATLPVNF